MAKIRLGVVGVGNCASALIQGIDYYRNATHEIASRHIGLMNFDIGGYTPADIEVVCAFDVDARKVGKPVSEAIFSPPNCTTVFIKEITQNPVKVLMGHVYDGVPSHMDEYPESQRFVLSKESPVDVVSVLKSTQTDVLICYLPVGSESAALFYAQCALEAKVGFVNCIPVFIASNPEWEGQFRKAGVPIVGDDIKSQVGATIVHRVLTRLFTDRGVKLERTYQLNTGGNTDFLNMKNHDRLRSKKISKTDAVQSQLDVPLEPENIHIGPSDYVPFQKDNKVCFLRMEGTGFGGVPLELEMRLSVEDSPNSAGVAIDAIRCCKLGLDRKVGGALVSISSYTMKHPPQQFADSEARDFVESYIQGKRER